MLMGVFMGESSPRNLPSHASLDELVEFVETHDMGDYLEGMPEAHFDVDIKRRMHLVAIDEEFVESLMKLPG
jgi:hypothetical protein